jgi:hypothetical protein
MGAGRKSAENASKIIDELMSIIDSESIEEQPKVKKKRRKKSENLDDRFWSSIEKEIGAMLIANYNQIRIMNSPEWYNWKKRARDRGMSVVVTEDQQEAKVSYVRPALMTGTLRERLKRVEVSRKKLNPKTVTYDSLEFSVDLDGLVNDYGNNYFRKIVLERTGQDILVLDEYQTLVILEMILNHYERG